jgi:NAD-dependent deacetylase
MHLESIECAANLLRGSKNTIAFTGAGISTPSGIPDFRSAHSGMWEKVDPLVVASIYGFRQNPDAFYQWIYPLARLLLNAQPNPAHLVLARMEERGYLKGVITQNIDMLHTRAGSRVVHELHGHMRDATCIHCFTIYPAEPIMIQFLDDRKVPHCPRCGGVIKPNVILYGEQLPVLVMQAAKEAARQAEVMLIVGSSLEVAPASDLPVLAQRNGAKLILINLEPTHVDSMAEVVIHADAAEILPQIMEGVEAVA